MHARLRHTAATFLPLGSSADPSSKRIIPTIQQLDPKILTQIFKLTAAQSVVERGKLEGVCRWWRAVIVQEPGFWTTIGIQYDTMPTLDALVTSHIPIYLERARKEPLSLYLGRRWPAAHGEASKARERAVVALLLDIFKMMQKPVESLSICTYWGSALPNAEEITEMKSIIGLRHLTLHCVVDDATHSPPGNSAPEETYTYPPTLTCLTIQARSLLPLIPSTPPSSSWPRSQGFSKLLTTLSITNLSPNSQGYTTMRMERLFDLLDSLLHLQSLSFDELIVDQALSGAGPWLVTSIRCLAVKRADSTALNYLLGRLAPMELTLDACTFSTPVAALPLCVGHLTLANIPQRYSPAMHEILSSWRGTHLVVHGSPFFSDFFLSNLQRNSALNQQLLLPGLQHVTVFNCVEPTAGGMDALRSFIAQQNNPSRTWECCHK
ncbi:hypothetical protein D9611_012247 [Ephemerocybe angulata]|uniref:F-box domain-containing protein n=1 Tax=Ephemerocybe angulata TaxID=980116 RepID=A0A8H5ATF9_9AGAR|nr:hypothetical protein D9611_012247 [Tulosesus angulatus]